MGCVFVYVIFLALIGPENLGQKFDVAHDRDMAEAAGEESMAAVLHKRQAIGTDDDNNDVESSESEKGVKRGTVRKEVVG